MKLAEIARRALMPRRPLLKEEGSVRLPALVFEHLSKKRPLLDSPEIGVLVFVLAQMENAASLSPNGRIERDHDDGENVLVIDVNCGLGSKFDVDDRIRGWQVDIKHLHSNGWLQVERRGQELRVKRGPLMRPGGKPKAAS
jgi:hypothetical protein